MKSASARTLDLFPDEESQLEYGSSAPSPQSVTGSPHNFKAFDELAAIRPQTVRMAGRLNAASVSDTEHKALLRERQTLLNKKFSGEITRQESNRLEYVRWSLDRIEDAKHGSALDALEASVVTYENFLLELQELDRTIRQPTQSRK